MTLLRNICPFCGVCLPDTAHGINCPIRADQTVAAPQPPEPEIELPPLPPAHEADFPDWFFYYYEPEEMEEYARAAVLLDRSKR